VPELAPDQQFAYASKRIVAQWREAEVLGIAGRAVVLGPVTFLRLSRRRPRRTARRTR
jgi:5-methyltetrahydropteroyltriglutamate--homocysteine methyltransferase